MARQYIASILILGIGKKVGSIYNTNSKDNPKVNMADLNFIIGINGHLLYTVKPEVARAEKPAMRLQKNKQYRT